MTAAERRLRVGHTAITWADERIEDAAAAISSLGYHGMETFGWVLETLEANRRLGLFEKYGIPIVSSYFSIDIVNPTVRETELKKVSSWGRILKSKGGKWVVFGGNGVDRRAFDFKKHENYIIGFVNEAGKILSDLGLELCFHPHTGTPVETKGEIEELLNRVDSRYVAFAPDIGQIRKGGTDPLGIVREYLSMIKLVHFKDFSGTVRFDEAGNEIDTSGFCCYSPLGQGVVDLPAVLDILEKSEFDGYIMVELDIGAKMPITAEEAVAVNKRYLEDRGYRFVAR